MQDSDPRQDRIYRAIQILFLLDVLLGLGLAGVGYWGLDQPTIAWAGLGLAGIGILLWLFFRFLGRDAAAR
jgi:hypothetical protein